MSSAGRLFCLFHLGLAAHLAGLLCRVRINIDNEMDGWIDQGERRTGRDQTKREEAAQLDEKIAVT